jgi:hypothetical protein
MMDTVARLSTDIDLAFFKFDIQGNYLACPSEEARAAILQILPDIADTTCQDGESLRTITSTVVPSAVREMMQKRSEPQLNKTEVAEPVVEKQETFEPQQNVVEYVDYEEYEEDKNAEIVQVTTEITAVQPSNGSSANTTLSVAFSAQETEMKSDSEAAPMAIIIGFAVAGTLTLIALVVVAALFVVKPMLQRRRREQYGAYDSEAAPDKSGLCRGSNGASDQSPPIPTMNEIDE